MRTIELEFWILRLIDQVRKGALSDDGLVELKAQVIGAENT